MHGCCGFEGSIAGDALALQQEVEDFLFKEARYLDERKLTEWLDFFAEDVHYFMPIRRNIKFGDWDLEFSDPEREISYFDEGKDILEGRVRQINTGVHWAEEPVSRFEHLITNVEIVGAEGDEVEVNSKFFVYQNRLADEVQIFVGRRYDLSAPRLRDGVQDRQAQDPPRAERAAAQGHQHVLLKDFDRKSYPSWKLADLTSDA